MKRENSGNDPMSVLLVEDAAPIRERLRGLITERPMLRVAAETGTVSEAKSLFETVCPDAVLLDLALLGGSGADVLEYIRRVDGGRTVVIILSNYLEPEIYNHCSKLGADFLFNKSDEFEQAIETLHDLAQSQTFATTHAVNARRRQAKLVVPSSLGLHAYPASVLVKQAQAFDADIEISHHGKKESAKSILGVLTLCAGYSAKVTVTATGTDAEEAIRTITRLFASDLDESFGSGASAKMTTGLGKSDTILVVDDNEICRALIKTILGNHGYRVVEARNGVEAVAVLTANTGDIKAVILDMIMPEMDGSETMSVLRRMSPALPVLIVSGFMEPSLFENDAGTMLLGKPFHNKDLMSALQALLDRRSQEIKG